MHLMGVARYRAGESAEDIENRLRNYLTARGHSERDAGRGASSAMLRAAAAVDGVAGAAPC